MEKKFVNKGNPYKKSNGERKTFSDRKPAGDRGSYGERKPTGDRGSYGERKPYGDRGGNVDRKPYGDRATTGDKKTYGGRSNFSGGKPSHDRGGSFEKKPYSSRPTYSDRKTYDDEGNTGERKQYNERPTFENRKAYGERENTTQRKPYGDKPSFGDRKPYESKGRSNDRFVDRNDRKNRSSSKENGYKKPYVSKKDYKKEQDIKNDVIDDIIEDGEDESFQIEGRNAVLEALKADKPIDKLLVKKGEYEGIMKVIIAIAKEKAIVIKEMTKEKLDELSETDKHQGIIAFCAAHEYAEIDDIFKKATDAGEEPFILILDSITDPHNLGAIIRTANASGVHGVIIPKRRSASLNAVVGKTSAGALSYVPVARVANITNAIEDLKKRGVWVVASDMVGENLYKTNCLTGSLALVIGNEGDGVSRLVKEKCDFVVAIPMFGEIASLNASVASAVMMYEVVRRKQMPKELS